MPADFQSLTLKAVDLNTGRAVPYVPLGVQRAFHQSDARFRAFVGGAGLGKTQSCAVESLLAALTHPDSFNAILRWDQASLKNSTWLTLRQIISVSGLDCLIAKESNSNQFSKIEFTNGSVIQGFHSKSWTKFGGVPFSSAYIDEVSECPDSDAFDQLCLRVERSAVGPNRLWISGLPNGRNWYWEKFVQKRLDGHAFFTGSMYDNPYLKAGSADRAVEMYGEQRAASIIMGSFDVIEGRLLEMFDEKTHVLPRQLIPADWPRYCAIDPGFNPDPCAMLRAAVDKHGNIICDAEYLRHQRITEQWSHDILAVNQGVDIQWYAMDSTAWRETHLTPHCVADTAKHSGIYPLHKASNTAGYIDQSVSLLRSMLTPMPGRIHPLTGKEGVYPRLYFLDDLAHTITEVRNFRMRKAGAASALQGIKLPDHQHDLVDCLMFLVLETLHPAKADAKPALSEFWQEIHRRQNTSDPVPYLQQVSRIRR
jgi:phage terminase large subunit